MVALENIISPNIIDETMYQHIDLLNTCYQAFDEGAINNFIINTARSNSSLLILELIDKVFTTLQRTLQSVLMVLNNYILNHANLLIKYKKLILDRYKKVTEPIILHTNEFPHLSDKEYPRQFSSTTFRDAVVTLESKMMDPDYSYEEMEYEAETILMDFTDRVIGSPVDVSDIKEATKIEVTKQIMGNPIILRLDEKKLSNYIDEMIGYKSWKNDIKRIRKRILDDYKAFKSIHKAATEEIIQKETESLGYKTQTDLEKFNIHDYQRFFNFNRIMNYLLTSMVTVYETAYSTKLNIMKSKLDYNMEVISGILATTGVLSIVNGKPVNTKKVVDFQEIQIKL